MSLRIALISPVWFRVPPDGYGGIEWVVSLLADSLVEAGHDVTLFASGDSHTNAKLISVYDAAPSLQIGRSIPEMHHALACFERASELNRILQALFERQRPLDLCTFDILHDQVIRPHVVESTNMRMIQRRNSPHFLRKSISESIVRGLDSNNAVDARITRFPDFAHATRA